MRNRKVIITELLLRPNSEAVVPPQGLETERIRQLTRLTPIKRAIVEQEARDRTLTIEGRDAARKAGRRAPVLEEWAAEYEQTSADTGAHEWSSRYADGDWAGWAEDYVERVQRKGTAYRVQKEIAEAGAWDVGYDAVRDRVKRMRKARWIQGEGHLVQAGERLLTWRETPKGENDGWIDNR